MSEAIELAKKCGALRIVDDNGNVTTESLISDDELEAFYEAAVQRGMELALDILIENGKLGLIKEVEKTKENEMSELPSVKDFQDIMAAAHEKCRRLQRAEELKEMSAFIACATLQECKLIVDDLIDRVSTLVGLAPELEDAACSLNRSIEAERGDRSTML